VGPSKVSDVRPTATPVQTGMTVRNIDGRLKMGVEKDGRFIEMNGRL